MDLNWTLVAWLALGVIVLGALVWGGGWWWLAQRSAGMSPEVGLQDGRLRPCPSTPNCVSSQADVDDSIHRVDPIPFQGDPDDAWRRMRDALSQAFEDRVDVVTDDPTSSDYLHAEVRTRVVGFVDDLELLMDRQDGVFHVRSASRVGGSDLGANRERVQRLVEAFVRE